MWSAQVYCVGLTGELAVKIIDNGVWNNDVSM